MKRAGFGTRERWDCGRFGIPWRRVMSDQLWINAPVGAVSRRTVCTGSWSAADGNGIDLDRSSERPLAQDLLNAE